MDSNNNYYGGPHNSGSYPPPPPRNSDDVFATDRFGKSRGVCALLAIFLGSFGIQYFYLGKNTAGVIVLICTWLLCGIPSILWIIQGILMLTMSSAEFERKFETTPATFPIF